MSVQSVKESRGSYLATAAKELIAAASESSFDEVTFFEKFELFADLPNAVSDLRNLVKRLAITGRLVPQQKNEGTSGLLDKLVVERNQFLAQHGVRRPHRIRPIKDNELRWIIPASWDVARICHVCHVQAGFAFKSSNFVQGESGTPII